MLILEETLIINLKLVQYHIKMMIKEDIIIIWFNIFQWLIFSDMLYNLTGSNTSFFLLRSD